MVRDSATGQTIHSFFAYAPGFTGGVRVASGDFDGDGRADILTGPGVGGGPHIKGFDGDNLSSVVSFFGFGSTFTGGVFVAAPAAGGGQALRAVGQGSGAAALTQAELDDIVGLALAQLAVGRDLSGVKVRVADLPSDYLGLAYRDLVLIDADAAGHGWSTDGDADRVDLLSAVAHELGHLLGLDDLDDDADHLMAGRLATGVSHSLNAVDDAFAELGAE
jgi:hypothetical protein